MDNNLAAEYGLQVRLTPELQMFEPKLEGWVAVCELVLKQ